MLVNLVSATTWRSGKSRRSRSTGWTHASASSCGRRSARHAARGEASTGPLTEEHMRVQDAMTIVRCIASLVVLPVASYGQTASRPDDAVLRAQIEAYVAPLAANELSGTLLVARG